jgi:hypothetical protein
MQEKRLSHNRGQADSRVEVVKTRPFDEKYMNDKEISVK